MNIKSITQAVRVKNFLRHNCLKYMRGVKKQHLPQKECLACKRPFTWRKKWEKDWEQVKYCSQKCKQQKHI